MEVATSQVTLTHMIGRAWLLGLLMIVAVGAIWIRLFQLQIIRGEQYAKDIDDDRQVVDFIPARRGRILDRHGTIIVDNRAVYNAAVILGRLELPRRERRRLYFHTLDRRQMDNLLADLAVRTLSGGESSEAGNQLRSLVTEELLRFPGVAVRRGKQHSTGQSTELGILALDQQSLTESESGDSSFTALFERGLLTDDPAMALAQEYLERRGETSSLLTPKQYRNLIKQLSFAIEVPEELVAARVDPFVPVVHLHQADADTEQEATQDLQDGWRWHLLTDAGRTRAEDALARFFGIDLLHVREALTDLLSASPNARPSDRWLFIPSCYSERAEAHLHETVFTRSLSVSGTPPAQERVFIIQGDTDAEASTRSGMLSLFCRRLATSLDYPADELARLIVTHGSKRRSRSLERQYRVHQMAFDADLLQTFCSDLTKHLNDRGLSISSQTLEATITINRRRADRDWAGFTRNDPLIMVRDLPRDIAVSLAGMGEQSRDADPKLADDYLATQAPLPGLRIITDMGRHYPPAFDGKASHVVGWLKRLSATYDRETALALGLDPHGWTGDWRGLEHTYDRTLQGVIGRRHRLRIPGGYKLLDGGLRPAQAGNDLHTTLDMELQVLTEDSLSKWFELALDLGTIPTTKAPLSKLEEAKKIGQGRGGMVVMDCHSGAVLALASVPGFKLSEVRSRYRELDDKIEHPEQPLQDNACWPLKPPGSTVKPLVGLAAMMEGVYKPGQRVFSPGHMGTWRGKYILPDHAPFGPHNGGHSWSMEQAIEASSNTFFAMMAERLEKKRGKECLASWYRRFGIGVKNAVDAPWQRAGVLTTPANIGRVRPAEAWQQSDTWRFGIGQFIAPCASPLQLVSIPAAIANGGTILRPYLAHDAAKEAVAEKLDIPPAVLRVLQRGMERVTESGGHGTAKKLKLAGNWSHVQVAAKTGTSEWGRRNEKPDNSWLIGYAPADKPQVAFAVFLFATGTSGGRACSGVAKRVLEGYFEIQRRHANQPQ